MKIYKHTVTPEDIDSGTLVIQGTPMTMAMQNDDLCIWFVPKPLNETVVYLLLTGHEYTLDDDRLKFIGTAMMADDTFVVHAFAHAR